MIMAVFTSLAFIVCGLLFITYHKKKSSVNNNDNASGGYNESGGTNNSNGNNDPKSIKIENTSEVSGLVVVWVFAELPQGDDLPVSVAMQAEDLSHKNTFELVIPKDTIHDSIDGMANQQWTGNGDYYVAVIPAPGGVYQWKAMSIFTNGGNSPVAVSFDTSLVTLDYSNFKHLQHEANDNSVVQ